MDELAYICRVRSLYSITNSLITFYVQLSLFVEVRVRVRVSP